MLLCVFFGVCVSLEMLRTERESVFALSGTTARGDPALTVGPGGRHT